MKLNHINLTVSDVQQMAGLLEKYFGLRRTKMDNQNMAFMHDDNDSFISMFKGDNVDYPEMFHIGFTQETVEQVNDIHARLLADGLAPETPKEEHGRWTFYFRVGGVMIEVQKFHQTW